MNSVPGFDFDYARFSDRSQSLPSHKIFAASLHRSDWHLRLNWDELGKEDGLNLDLPFTKFEKLFLKQGLAPARQSQLRTHVFLANFSQFLHGEQFAVHVLSGLVSEASDLTTKGCMVLHAADEMKHIEVLSQYFALKFGGVREIHSAWRSAFAMALEQSVLAKTAALHCVLEPMAATFLDGTIRFLAKGQLQSMLLAILQEENRHIAFGVDFVRERWADLTQAERGVMEDFLIELCQLMKMYVENDIDILSGQLDDFANLKAKVYLPSAELLVAKKNSFRRVWSSMSSCGLLTEKISNYMRQEQMI